MQERDGIVRYYKEHEDSKTMVAVYKDQICQQRWDDGYMAKSED